MKETNHQKILRILREAKGGWVCTTVFDTEYIRDHRKRVSELIQQGYKIISEQCKGECGRNHSSNIFKRKLVEIQAPQKKAACCPSMILLGYHSRDCEKMQKAAEPATSLPTLF